MIRVGCVLLLLLALLSTARASEIPVFIFAGQSNAVGNSTATSELTGSLASLAAAQPNVLFFGPTHETVNKSWAGIVPPTETSQVAGGSGFGPELSAGRDLRAALGGQIAIVKYAINGTDLASQWSPTLGNSLYYGMVSRVNQGLDGLKSQLGLNGRVAGFFWMQGESDTDTVAEANAYQTNLTNFITRLRSDFNSPNLPLVLGEIGNAFTYQNTVRAAQANIPNVVNNAAFVDTDSFARSSPGNLIHFSTQGTVDLGIAFAAAQQTLTPALSGPTNLVTNGSFETNVLGPAFQNVSSGVTGWTITGEGELVRGFNATVASHGAQWWSLESNGGLAFPNNVATISQTIATVPGQLYQLSFDYSALGNSSVTGPWTLSYDYGSGLQQLQIANASQLTLAPWARHSVEFVAAGSSTTLSFTGQTRAAGFYGPAIDNVVLTAVPEPGSLAMLLCGGTFLWLVRRKRTVS